ncbi:fasciclin domain-containing protein [Natronoflexus pectinivorans]|uniref:Transforming growth factor-beta-induced protein n=1 Tax=Natronoflexus pectinivorans TaxID=682526 RepID=A0A4R2GI92_9BACT|nr:fasciclin domain-containing protein [Natronoflexus pectinivorans]TCO08267.1 transforming growth factor-beta-induced protein [Natronoflexus pectinivorans]
MKKYLRFPVLAILLSGFLFYACSDDDKDEQMATSKTIVDVAVENEDFSILVEAVTKAGLANALADRNASLTVFAPTNAAFASLLEELGASSLDDIPNDLLTSVLLYHVLGEQKTAAQLNDGYYSTLSAGPAENLNLSLYKSGTKLNNRANITATNIMADNGVIHVIDKVILPLSITGHAVANDAFSSLVAAVEKAELAGTLDSDEVSLTVFAPVNAAFSQLLSDLGVTLADLTAEDLTPILLYHVLDGIVPSSAVTSGYFPTLATAFDNNVSLGIAVDNGVVLNGSSNVVVVDVVATNGVIHAIDQVLTQPNIVDAALSNPLFSYLVEAVVKAELVEALSGEGPLTVFAPTNAAFEALFAALEVDGIDDIDVELLTSVLLAHVVGGNVLSGDLSSGSVSTLNDEKSLDIAVNGGVTIDGDINVVLADVQTSNGVIHVIDGVILP